MGRYGLLSLTFDWVRTWSLHNYHAVSINRSFLIGKLFEFKIAA